MRFIDKEKKDHGEYVTWKLSHTFKGFGAHRAKTGKVVVAKKNKNQKNLSISLLGYSFGKNEVSSTSRYTYTFRVKNNRIYLYEIRKDEKAVRDVTLKIEKVFTTLFYTQGTDNKPIGKWNHTAILKFKQVFNYFLKENNFPRKLNLKKETATRDLVWFIYPTLKDFGITAPFKGCPLLKDGASVKDVIKKYFGVNSKQVTKLVCETVKNTHNLEILNDGRVLKKLVKLDHIHVFLKNGSTSLRRIVNREFRGGLTVKTYRDFLKSRSEIVRTSLIKDVFQPFQIGNITKYTVYRFLDDTIRMVRRVEERGATIPNDVQKEWERLHDWLTDFENEQTYENLKINYSEEELVIDNAEIDDLKITLPKDSRELKKWGKALSHCVGSYDHRAARKQSNILGVKKRGEIKYCIELQGKSLIQFRGRFNADPDKEDERKVLKLLKENKIIHEQQNIAFDDILD